MDDQQRARDYLQAAWVEAGWTQEAAAALASGNDTSMNVQLSAITAALRAATEVTYGAVDRAAKALHANGADSITSDTPWSELHDGEVNQFRSWARAALLAARPQGVKDRPGIDGCTESNCKRCRTHPDHRGGMEHAGIGWRPDSPQEASDEI